MAKEEEVDRQERQAALERSEKMAREADRSFAKHHRDGDPPPAAKS